MISNDVYGHQVEMTTDGVHDVYVVGGARSYTFPAGTADGPVSVAIAIQENLVIFNASLTEYINSCYSIETRTRWIALYLEFQSFNKPNKMAYVTQLLSWGNSISIYSATYIATVMTMTDLNLILAARFDANQFPIDPQINLLACMQISG